MIHGRYFADLGRATSKLEKAKDDAEKALALREIRIAAEFARQSLPNVR